jgi:hypothetical protein
VKKYHIHLMGMIGMCGQEVNNENRRQHHLVEDETTSTCFECIRTWTKLYDDRERSELQSDKGK